MSESTTQREDESWRGLLAETLGGGPLALTVPIVLAVLVILLPVLSNDSTSTRELALISVLALVVSGLNLTFGYVGELQFSQVFTFALGCYVTMILSTAGWNDLILLLIVGGAVAALAGAVIALPALRVSGWSLALTSFFVVLTIPELLVIFQSLTGGLNGLVNIPDPRLLGRSLGANGLYEVTIIVTVIWFVFFRNLVTSRYGVIFRILRQSPVLAMSLGFSPARLKITAYALGSLPAGMAGCLFGFISLVVGPSSFDLSLAIGIVAASILGGSRSIYGPCIGAVLLHLGSQNSLRFHQYAPVVYGLSLILAAVVFRRGVAGLGGQIARRLGRALAGEAHAPPPPACPSAGSGLIGAFSGVPLTVDAVSKAFGGVNALTGISFTARPGEVTGLIGSNGSGKTTLLNVICGYTRADGGGTVSLGDAVINNIAPYKISRLGVARTFQTPTQPDEVSVLEFVASGRFSSDHHGLVAAVLRSPRYRRSRNLDRREAAVLLERVGLAGLSHNDVATLSLGDRRLVELARALCARPRLLLLDEPASGLTAEETDRLGNVIKDAARAGATVILIEHNFSFVARFTDVTHVLNLGVLIASGPPAVIQENPVVIESVLGRRDAAPAVRTVGGSAVGVDLDDGVLGVHRVVAGYGNVEVLHRVSVQLRRGTIEVVLGPNGAGKTTLLETIAGLTPLKAGAISLDGCSIGRLPAHRRAALGIALVQQGRRIFQERTIMENILLGTYVLSLSRRERARACAEILNQFPVLAERAYEVAGSLSGGQQQMLAIGQALAARPKVLLLDEPSAGLALSSVDDLFDSVRRLADHGTTILLVEQLEDQASAIADHVTVFDAGKVKATYEPGSSHRIRGLDAKYLATDRIG